MAEDRHKYERELVLARKRAEALLAKTASALFAEQMMGIVSHDLRNPLTAIQIGAHLLGRGELSAKQRVVISRIINSTNRANRLIADLLDFTAARLGAGLTIHAKPCDLHTLVAENVAELAATFPERTLTHQQRGEGTAFADADRLAQLIGNLVGNAVAYGDAACAITIAGAGRDNAVVAAQRGRVIPDLSPRLRADGARWRSARRPAQRGLGLFTVRESCGERREIVALRRREGTTFRARFAAEGVA